MWDLESMWLEVGEEGEQSESPKETEEQAQQRIADDEKKAKQIKKQLQSFQQQNKNLAMLLSMIFQSIEDEDILWYVHDFLFQKDVELEEIFMVFLPYLKEKVNRMNSPFINEKFWKIDYNISDSVSDYSRYIKENIWNSKLIKEIQDREFIDFLKRVIYYFDVWGIKEIMEEKDFSEYEEKLENSLREVLY